MVNQHILHTLLVISRLLRYPSMKDEQLQVINGVVVGRDVFTVLATAPVLVEGSVLLVYPECLQVYVNASLKACKTLRGFLSRKKLYY